MSLSGTNQSKSRQVLNVTYPPCANIYPDHISNAIRSISDGATRDPSPRHQEELVVHQSNSVGNSVLDRLPTETLSEIFLFYLSSIFLLTNYSPFVLGAVCRRWRQIAWTTPRVWTTFNLDTRAEHISATCIELAADWLSRAGAHPLTIKFHASSLNVSDPELPQLYRLINIFNSYASQWYHLDLSIPSDLLAQLNDSAASKSACLDELALGSGETWPTTSLNHVAPRIILSKHSSLDPLSLNWSFVTHLTAGLRDGEELLQIIKLSPRLEECKVKLDEFWGVRSTHSRVAVVHPVMKSLDITAWVHNSEEPVLDYLNLPALEHLRVEGNDDALSLDAFLSFLRRCTGGLKSLVLDDFVWSAEGLIEVARSTPTLESLDVSINGDYEVDTEDFHYALAGLDDDSEDDISPPMSTEALLPNLREYKWASGEIFPWDTLIGFLGPISRESQSLHTRRPLTLVHIRCSIVDFIPYIDKDVLYFLADFTNQVQFQFRLPPSDYSSTYEDCDIWKLSAEKYLDDVRSM